MGKKWVPTDPQQMNLPIYEGFFFPFFFSLLETDMVALFLCQCQSGQAFCNLPFIFHAPLPMFEWIDRMWVLRYHNYHIRQAIWAETGALTLHSWLEPFSASSLFKREGWNRREGETRGSPGAYLSLKSHLRALSILFLKEPLSPCQI